MRYLLIIILIILQFSCASKNVYNIENSQNSSSNVLYRDARGEMVKGDIIPEGYNLIPPLGAPPNIILFDNEGKYKEFLKLLQRDLNYIGYWSIQDSTHTFTTLSDLIDFTKDFWDENINSNIVAYIFIYHHSENRVSIQNSDEYNRFIKTYCLGKQDNLDGENKNSGPLINKISN